MPEGGNLIHKYPYIRNLHIPLYMFIFLKFLSDAYESIYYIALICRARRL